MKQTNIRLHFNIAKFWAVSALLFISATATASTSKHAGVEEGAKQYLLSQLDEASGNTDLDVSIVEIDERINIPNCPTGFQYNASEEALAQSYISVRVSCRNNDWYLFTGGQVTRTKEIVVLQGAVSPGTVLTSSNLTLAKVDVKRLRHTAFRDIDSVVVPA